MNEALINAVFQPTLSKQETKADATTRTARGIIDAEAARRDAKTERLRLARLERDRNAAAEEPKPASKKKKTASRRKQSILQSGGTA